jgi:hypothetical protein
MDADEFHESRAGWDGLRELIDGSPRPVRPGRLPFFRVVANLSAAFKRHLKGSAYATLIRGQALHVDDRNVLFPDVFVVEDSDECWAPRLVVAVIDSTDREPSVFWRTRIARRMDSVQEILLINLDERCIKLHRRDPDGSWTAHVVGAEGTATLRSLHLELPAATVFDQLDRADPALTLQEFLEWDKDEELRHEYFSGRIVTKEGAKGGHLQAIVNIQLALDASLQGTGRRLDHVNHSDASSELDDAFFFDVGIFEEGEKAVALNAWPQPSLLIEAHSGTIGRRARVARTRERLQQASLREYVQIDCRRRRVTVHRRDPSGAWTRLQMPEGAPMELAAIDATVPAEVIFKRI